MADKNIKLKQPTETYRSMPVPIGENVTVTIVCECVDKFFLSPYILPDDVSNQLLTFSVLYLTM